MIALTPKRAPDLSQRLTDARHKIDNAVFTIHALMQHGEPTPMFDALRSISGQLQSALADLGECDAKIGAVVTILGGVR